MFWQKESETKRNKEQNSGAFKGDRHLERVHENVFFFFFWRSGESMSDPAPGVLAEKESSQNTTNGTGTCLKLDHPINAPNFNY